MNVYLDNAATTKVDPQVIDKMLPFFRDNYGNASSVHGFGRKTRVAIEESREIIAEFVNADPSEIYFTSGGTEANNFIINGIAKSEFRDSGRNHLITSSIEHPSVLDTFKKLDQNGFQTSIIDVDDSFAPSVEKITEQFNSDTSLISIMSVNNEVGSSFDISKLKNIGGSIYLHTDAVQRFGKTSIDVKELGIHSLTASAHKIHGPKGIGLAFVKSQTPMESLIVGGGQERNRRAGTENIANIVGFAEAVNIVSKQLEKNYQQIKSLKSYFLNSIVKSKLDGIIINSPTNSSPYILSITLDPKYYSADSEALLMFFDINGIAVSAGSACASGTLKASHVILAANKSEEYANGTLRFSFNPENTTDEIDYAIEILKIICTKFSKN